MSTRTSKRPGPCGVERLGVIMLAAGYGTRLQQDIDENPGLSSLSGIPKPLLPLGGKPILSHWLEALESIPAIERIVVVTNDPHRSLYQGWAGSVQSEYVPEITVVSDGSVDNDSRLGAIADINLGLKTLIATAADKAMIIAGDTLLPDVDMYDFVASFVARGHKLATFAYPLTNMADCSRRGMFKVKQDVSGILLAEGMVEKPPTPSDSPSNLACAPVYIVQRSIWSSFGEFLKQRHVENASIVETDAPGFWLSWLAPRESCRLFKIHRRIDIGGLKHYLDALLEFSFPKEGVPEYSVLPRAAKEPGVGRAHPRLGLLGNPSDGYGGKVIAVSIASEGYAQVVATPSAMFVVHRNSAHELDEEFYHLRHLVDHVESRGLHYSARKLVLAAAVGFTRRYGMRLSALVERSRGGESSEDRDPLLSLPNCQLTYSTSIPARVGLAGSSALILATLRALARFYNTSLEEINSDLRFWPKFMRSIETELLGISCGLMDRVIQIMQGCVTMDFTRNTENETTPLWTRLPEASLPELWLAYRECKTVGECSGVVHGKLKERFIAKDSRVLKAVEQFCEVVESGKNILEKSSKGDDSSMNLLPELVNKNFALRCQLLGEAGVGERNMELIRASRKAGFASKLTGSGGCALCVPSPLRKLTSSEVKSASETLQSEGFVLHRVEVLSKRDWPPPQCYDP